MNVDTLKAMYLNFHNNITNSDYVGYSGISNWIPCDITFCNESGTFSYGMYFIDMYGKEYNIDTMDMAKISDFLSSAIPVFVEEKDDVISIVGVNINHIKTIKLKEY